MIEINSITSLMQIHHRILNNFLSNFEKVPEEESGKLEDLFNTFKDNLKKHFLAEETNIFSIVDRKNKKEVLHLNNLLKDHKDFREIIKNLDEEISVGRKPNMVILKELLFAHQKREIESFYPFLDKRLSEEEKKDIVNKINEVRLG